MSVLGNLPSLALNGLNEERSCVLAVKLKCTFDVRDLAIANCSQTSIIIKGRSNLGKVGTETSTTLGVSAHTMHK